MALILYDYHRSSAAYRVRIALNLKGADYERVPINLLEGEQKAERYRARNPQGFVPMLEADGKRLTQSLAIIAWLDSQISRAAPAPGRSGRPGPCPRARPDHRRRHPPDQQSARAEASRRPRRRSGRARRLVPPLDQGRLRRAGGAGRAARRPLPVRRSVDPRRHLPGAADVQCPPLRGAISRLSDPGRAPTPRRPSSTPSPPPIRTGSRRRPRAAKKTASQETFYGTCRRDRAEHGRGACALDRGNPADAGQGEPGGVEDPRRSRRRLPARRLLWLGRSHLHPSLRARAGARASFPAQSLSV